MGKTKTTENPPHIVLTSGEENEIAFKRQTATEANFVEKCKMLLEAIVEQETNLFGRKWSIDLGDGTEIKREINFIHLPSHYAACNETEVVSVVFNGKEVFRHEEFRDAEDAKKNTQIISGFIEGEWGGNINLLYPPSKKIHELILADTEEMVKKAFELEKELRKSFGIVKAVVKDGNAKRAAFGIQPIFFFEEAERHEAFRHLIRGF